MGYEAILFDYGGVLTTSAHESFRHYELEEDLPEGLIGELLRSRYASEGLLADVELGRQDPDVLDGYFRQALAEMGWHVGPRPIHLALFSKVMTEPAMWECVAGLRTNGIATALLSNSWGTSLYDFDLVDQHFDVNVISGHVGLRKPDREIFVKTAELLSVTPEACIFVDDMDVNVQAAKAAGMTRPAPYQRPRHRGSDRRPLGRRPAPHATVSDDGIGPAPTRR